MTKPLRRSCYTVLALTGLLTKSPAHAYETQIGGLKSPERSSSAPAAVKGSDGLTGLVVEEMAPGLYRIVSTAGSNVLALHGDGGALLVDAGPAEGAEQLQDTLDSLGIGTVSYVVITHYHDDHLAGAAWFKTRGATIVAHVRTRTEAAVDTVIPEWDNWHRQAAAPDAIPDDTFNTERTIRIGSHNVQLVHMPRAHTGGDVIVRFEDLGVIHTGDIYEVGAYPFIDHWAGGTITGMIGALDYLATGASDETVYVPGHGTPGERAQLEEYRGMLERVCQAVLSRIRAGDDLRQARAAQPTAPFDDTTWGTSRHGGELTTLVYWSLFSATSNATCAPPQ